MEMNLNGVIEKIKSEGIGKAEEEAKALIKEAEEKAKKIGEEAKRSKTEIIKKAEEESRKIKETAEASIKQAARDVIISLRSRIEKLFDTVIKKEITGQMKGDLVKEIIVKMVTECAKTGEMDLEILLSEQEKEQTRGALEGLLQEELKKGVVLKVAPKLEKGFRIGKKGTNEYYDFSDEAVAEAFSFYLNKKIREIIDAGME